MNRHRVQSIILINQNNYYESTSMRTMVGNAGISMPHQTCGRARSTGSERDRRVLPSGAPSAVLSGSGWTEVHPTEPLRSTQRFDRQIDRQVQCRAARDRLGE